MFFVDASLCRITFGFMLGNVGVGLLHFSVSLQKIDLFTMP